MQSRLIVRNFGPIEFVDIDLRNVNVFIGPQASGKSALAKLYTIFKAPRKFIKNTNITFYGNIIINKPYLLDILEEYNIASFLKPETEIEFDTKLHSLSYKNDIITYEPKLLKKVQHLKSLKSSFTNNRNLIARELENLFIDYQIFYDRAISILNSDLKQLGTLNENQFFEILEIIDEIEVQLSTHSSLYIPSERNFINIVKNASLNLLLNNVPIPKHILAFGAEIEKATTKEIDLAFLHENLAYKNINGEDRIFTDKVNSIKLSEAASGIQSVIPILIPALSHPDISYHKSFVIEEPELNLFPTAQYELIKLLESNRVIGIGEDNGTIHTYTTHSPYILSAINNLLYAFKVKKELLRRNVSTGRFNREHVSNEHSKVDDITSSDIHPQTFTAYQIANGKAEDIFNRETGLIKDNYIDKASDKMADDFEALMELMK